MTDPLDRDVAAVDRRGFIRSAALGAMAATGSLSLMPAAMAAPRRGGVLRVAFDNDSATETLDPATVGESFKVTLAHGTLRSNLTEITATGELVPELAESWEVTPDAKTWTFKLRKGVQFHNGKPLTAEDVIASMNHHRGPETKSGAKALLAPVDTITADGPHTVVFKLKSGIADFAYYVSIFQLQICPVIDGKLDVLSGIGTGPYVLKEFTPGVRASAVRNPNYFKSDRAFFDAVEYRAMPDAAARTNALLTGAVDVVVPAEMQTIDLLKRRRDIEVFSVSGRSHHIFPMRNVDAPFGDNRVRLAFKHAFDRKAHLEKILRGYGSIGNDQPIAPSDPFFFKDLEQLPFDPEKSRFYLKQAGLSTVNVSLHASDGLYAGCIDACSLFRETAAKAGINVQVVREPRDGYFANVWRKRPFCASYWVARPTADMQLTTVFSSGAPYNEAAWEHARFNVLLNEARAMLDVNARKERYAEIQKILRDEGPSVIPAFTGYVGAATTKLAHGPIGSNSAADNNRIAERWWFA